MLQWVFHTSLQDIWPRHSAFLNQEKFKKCEYLFRLALSRMQLKTICIEADRKWVSVLCTNPIQPCRYFPTNINIEEQGRKRRLHLEQTNRASFFYKSSDENHAQMPIMGNKTTADAWNVANVVKDVLWRQVSYWFCRVMEQKEDIGRFIPQRTPLHYSQVVPWSHFFPSLSWWNLAAANKIKLLNFLL